MRKHLNRAFFITASLILIASLQHSTEVQAAIVYDNTTTSLGYFVPLLSPGVNNTTAMVGDQISLAGSERDVTEVRLPIYENVLGNGTVDIILRFYENDGSGGAPGTLLWESVWDNSPFNGGTNIYNFTGLNIQVPDTFTWALQLTDRTGPNGAMGPMLFDPPTVGSSDDFRWSFNGTSWSTVNSPDLVDNLNIRVSAVPVPEPSTFLLLAAGLAGVGLLRKRFKS